MRLISSCGRSCPNASLCLDDGQGCDSSMPLYSTRRPSYIKTYSYFIHNTDSANLINSHSIIPATPLPPLHSWVWTVVAGNMNGVALQQMFHPEQFRNAISSGQGQVFHQLVRKVVWAVGEQEQLFALRMVEEVSGMVRSQSESPVLKFKVAKLIMYLILLAEPGLLKQFAQKIYPPIKNACLFNRSQPIITRGMDFFKNNKYYEIANFEEKSKIKNIGCRYIVFCLQCVYMLAEWLPKDQDTRKPSLFLTSYQMLLKQGVEFPNPGDFTFFTQQRIKSIEEQLGQCQQEVGKLKQRQQEEYFESGKSRFDAVNMNGVEYLQKKLKEKDKIIKDMRNNGSVHEVQKHSVVEKLKQQERDNLEKIEAYEEKVAHLTQEVREMKHLLRIENRSPPTHDKDKIQDLEAKVNLLCYQNSRLKEELAKKSSLLSQRSNKEQNTETYSLPRVQSLQHIRQLIQITHQPHQPAATRSNLKAFNFQFSNQKSIKQLMYPIFDALSKESQIRLRKCLLKSKEVLYKNRLLEVGMISALVGDIQLQITIIITNLSEQTLSLQGVTFQSTKQLTVTTLNNATFKKLKPGEQVKIQLTVQVNHLDSKCLTFTIRYTLVGAVEEIPLIMPVCGIKLLKYAAYSSFKESEHQKLMREITVEKRVISNREKLKNYLPKCFVEKHIHSQQFYFKVQFLTKTFYLKLEPLADNHLLIKVYFKQPQRPLAQKILDDFTFIIAT